MAGVVVWIDVNARRSRQIMAQAEALERVELRCGPLSMLFEPDSGFVRYIRAGGIEVLRGIYAVVRDHNWDTVPTRLEDVRIERAGDGFDARFTAICQAGEIDFRWEGRLTGDPAGVLRYRFDGHARSAFRRNRIGFCILHPVAPCRGRPCTVEHLDGSRERGRFPEAISPHQPFQDIRAITHEVAPGLAAEVRMEGDAFEMEDQRNWTDASYKTYCTPLGLGFPVRVEAGERVEQVVTLSLQGEARGLPPAPSSRDAVRIELEVEGMRRLPAIGLGAASHGEPLTRQQVRRLRRLAPAHLRIDLPLAGPDWPRRLAQAREQAEALDTGLEVALFLSPDDHARQLDALRQAFADSPPPVHRWLVFPDSHGPASTHTIDAVRQLAAERTPTAAVGSGTDCYFTELNRQRPDASAMDVVCYSLNPQVHAFDDASLIETLPMQVETVSSARRLAAGRPIVISPVTLRPRFNPNATGPEPEPPPGELPSQVDPRQPTLFAAAWTLGSIKHLAEAGAAAATYYETTGWRGVMETDAGPPLPRRFPSRPGAVFPLYHVLADVAEFADAAVVPTRSTQPLRGEALMLRRGGAARMLVANYDTNETRFELTGVPDAPPRCRVLGPQNVDQACDEPEALSADAGEQVKAASDTLTITLPPRAVARLDWHL